MTRPTERGTHRRSCRTCGWSGTYDTAARGDYAKRRHSCERHLRLAARKANGEAIRARHALIDRTPKPCLHQETTHVHGTYACWTLDKCRCWDCTAAQRVYEQQRVRNNAYGRSNYVDAQPARDHVKYLMDHGMGLKRIVTVSDVSMGALWKLIYGKRQADGTQRPSVRVTRDLERRILAIEVDLADGARINGHQTARRLQALIANGWSAADLGRRLNIHASNLTPVLHGRRKVVVSTAKAVHALYVELVDQAPPAGTPKERAAITRARSFAAANNWAPPLRIGGKAWIGKPYDIRADVPDDARPVLGVPMDEAAILRRLDGDRVRLTNAEAAEVVRRWVATGRPLVECERTTGLNVHRFLRNQREAS